MLLLYRHWILPGRLRRAPRWVLFALLLPAIIGVWLATQANTAPAFISGSSMTWLTEMTVNFAPALTSLFGLISGALSIAMERQKQTWEPLILTRLKSAHIVHAKLAVILTQGLLCFLAPFIGLFHMAFQGMLRYYTMHYNPAASSHEMFSLEAAEGWGITELCLRLTTFTLIGMAISAACQRVQTSLTICGGIVAAYTGLYQGSERIYRCHPGAYDDHLYAHLFYWPIMSVSPYDFLYYYFQWRLRLAADLIWGIALPTFCYILLRLKSRRIHTDNFRSSD